MDRFLADRITELRMRKGVTEARMSSDLGRGRSYINRITTGRGYPGYEELLRICTYLGVTPGRFFGDSSGYCRRLQELAGKMEKLDARELEAVEEMVNCFLRKS